MSEQKEVAVRPAATILLCRDAAEGLETFMVLRHHQIDFASGALVFPGGKLGEQDQDPGIRERCDGADGVSNESLAFQVAAIREAFEESGILLARERGSSTILASNRLNALEPYRERLNAGELGILEFLEKEDLVLACDCLHDYAHWITPEGMPKRFDTHFFIAKAPEDHVGAHDGSESVDSVWITPQRVLKEAQEGKWTVIFPTRCNIQLLDESKNIDDAIARSQGRDIMTILPWIENRDGSSFVCIPTEAGYPVSSEKFRNRP